MLSFGVLVSHLECFWAGPVQHDYHYQALCNMGLLAIPLMLQSQSYLKSPLTILEVRSSMNCHHLHSTGLSQRIMRERTSETNKSFYPQIVAWIVWLVSLLVEHKADLQKKAFVRQCVKDKVEQLFPPMKSIEIKIFSGKGCSLRGRTLEIQSSPKLFLRMDGLRSRWQLFSLKFKSDGRCFLLHIHLMRMTMLRMRMTMMTRFGAAWSFRPSPPSLPSSPLNRRALSPRLVRILDDAASDHTFLKNLSNGKFYWLTRDDWWLTTPGGT